MQRETAGKTADAKGKAELRSSIWSERPAAQSPHPILQLHRLAGNRAVGRFLLAKLRVGQPGDAYEREADRVADEVLQSPNEIKAANSISRLVQTKRRAAGSAAPLTTAHPGIDSAGGQRIPALAYTVGRHTAFAPGQYSPISPKGQRLLARPLVGVTQRGHAAEPWLQRFTASFGDGDKVLIHPEKGDTDEDLGRVLCPAVKDRKIKGRKHIDVTECLPKSSIKSMGLGPYNCADFVRRSLGETPPAKKSLEWYLTPKLWDELLKKGYTIRGFGVVHENGKVEPAEGNISWKQQNPRMGDLVFMKGEVKTSKGEEPSSKGDNFTVTWDHVGIFIVRSRRGFDYHFAKDGDENPVGIYHTGTESTETMAPGAYVKGAGTLAAYLGPPTAKTVEEKKTQEAPKKPAKPPAKPVEKEPEKAGPSGILQRKCACGNYTIADGACSECGRMKQSGLQINKGNEPEDIYEHQADSIADQLLAVPAHHTVSSVLPRIQRFSGRSSGQRDAAPASVGQVLAGPGRPLEPALRNDMEQRFGHDFSQVRVHIGAKAAESAREVNALAYTVGHDIVFGAAQFTPGTHGGRRLLAHELAHTIQQGSKPLVATGGLMMSQSADSGEREAETATEAVMRAPRTAVAAAGVAAIRLGRTGLLVARQPAPKPPTPATCTMNCSDPAFLALSPSAREVQLNTQCPQGFPATGNTFFGQSIPAVSNTLRTKLLEAQSRAMRAICLNGQDPNAFVLTRSIITYAKHSPAMDKAVDIDLKGQPYIMHEKGEADIDKEVGEVYDRIAFWSRYRKSIIPKGITSVQRPAGGTGTQRTWTNPSAGKQEPITTGELYDMLKQESTGMQGYFNLLLKSESDLTIEVLAFVVYNLDPLPFLTKLKLPIDESVASVQAFRQRIADDYRLLGGSQAQLEAFAGKPIATASKAPPARSGDRPFAGGVPAGTTLRGGAPDPAQNRRPELGFINLPREIVVALTDVGLVWGAIDFGGESGDVMHFDCRALRGC